MWWQKCSHFLSNIFVCLGSIGTPTTKQLKIHPYKNYIFTICSHSNTISIFLIFWQKGCFIVSFFSSCKNTLYIHIQRIYDYLDKPQEIISNTLTTFIVRKTIYSMALFEKYLASYFILILRCMAYSDFKHILWGFS